MTPPHQAASAAAAAPVAARMDWTGWQTKFVASPPEQEPGFGVDPGPKATGYALHAGPYPPGLSRPDCLRSFNHRFALATPSDLARQARAVR